MKRVKQLTNEPNFNLPYKQHNGIRRSRSLRLLFFLKKAVKLPRKTGKKALRKNFLKKLKKNEKCRSKQLDLNFVSYYNK